MPIPREIVRQFGVAFGFRVLPQIVYITTGYILLVAVCEYIADISPLHFLGGLMYAIAYVAQRDAEALYVEHHGQAALNALLREEYHRRNLRVPDHLIEEGLHV